MSAKRVSFVLVFLSAVVVATAFFHHKPEPEEDEPSESPPDYPPRDRYPHSPYYPPYYPEDYQPRYPYYYPRPYPHPYRKPYLHWRKPHRRPRICGRRFCPRGTRCVFRTVPCFRYPCPRIPKCVPVRWGPRMRSNRRSPYYGY